jgi:hypothetical protein
LAFNGIGKLELAKPILLKYNKLENEGKYSLNRESLEVQQPSGNAGFAAKI